MSDKDTDALRIWAEAHAPAGSLQAKQILALLAYVERLRGIVRSLTDRVTAQAELLEKRAEKLATEIDNPAPFPII